MARVAAVPLLRILIDSTHIELNADSMWGNVGGG
jgi:hypothetical protein